MGFEQSGYVVYFCPSVDNRGRAWLYLGIALLALVVWLVGQWAIVTYYQVGSATGTIVALFIFAFVILGIYCAVRFRWLRYPT